MKIKYYYSFCVTVIIFTIYALKILLVRFLNFKLTNRSDVLVYDTY